MALSRTTQWIIAAGIAGGAYVLTRPSPVPTKHRPPPPEPFTKEWAQEIRSIAAPIESQTGWNDLGNFLVGVARGESGGKASACNVTEHGYCAPNSARGWFQLRPKSAFAYQLSHLQSQPELLFDKRWAVAMAAWYGFRLRKHAGAGQTLNWLALRRGWALPSLVKDVNEDKERSVKVRQRYESALGKVGLPDSFMYQRAFPPGFDWPGVEAILNMVGAKKVA
jgi:hypothetical protein